MTFAAPLFLIALAAAPLAWLLGRLRRRRVRVVVPSLLLWERVAASAGPPPARERRRVLDLRTATEMAALAALALAAAGPRAPGAAPPRRVAIVVDETPSMRARGPAGEATRLGAARAAARALEARLGPADEAIHASNLLEARASGADAVYFFTDHEAPAPWEGAPRLVSVLVGGGGANAGIVAAGARAGPDGALEIAARVEATAGPAPAAAPARLAAAPAGPVAVRIPGGDALAEDDAVTLLPPAAPPAVQAEGALSPEVVRALEAAGAVLAASGEVRVAVESAAAAGAGTGPRIAIAPLPGPGPAPERLVAVPNPLVRYALVSAQRLRVAPAAAPPDLRPILVDERGRTVIGYREERAGALVWIGIPLGLGLAATDWPRDRSFPVFFAEALGGLARRGPGEDAVWRAVGVLSAAETREAGPAPARPLPPEEPLAAPLEAGAAGAAADLAPAVLAAAAVLVLAAMALARERRLPPEEVAG